MKKNPVYIQAAAVAAAALVISGILYYADNHRQISRNEDGREILERNENGNDEQYDLRVKTGGKEEEIRIRVSGKAYTREELDMAFEDAGNRLEELILGENESADRVSRDLDLITRIPDSDITVSWELDNHVVMSVSGRLKTEALTQEGTPVKLTAVMKYGTEKEIRELFVNVAAPELSEEEQMLLDIQEQTKQCDEQTKTEDYMVLPDEVNGQELKWYYAKQTRASAVLVIGAGVSCMILLSSFQRKKEEEKRAVSQMKLDYPQIVNKFNLYIRSGMTVRRAWLLITQDYQNRYRKTGRRKAYEEMIYTMHEIQGGASESESYENYGIRCGISVYRKFGTMLSQNLRKGSRGMTELLSREASEAFEERKNLARKLGEEAGTKLMIPMFMMLAVVFAIVIVPAFFSIQI